MSGDSLIHYLDGANLTELRRHARRINRLDLLCGFTTTENTEIIIDTCSTVIEGECTVIEEGTSSCSKGISNLLSVNEPPQKES